MTKKLTVLSGIRPTGYLHSGELFWSGAQFCKNAGGF